MRAADLALLTLLLAGCGLQSELEGDPAHWAPEKLPSNTGDAAAEIEPPIEGCDVEPPYNPELRVSATDAPSHLADSPCLEGCHQRGGTAKLVLAVGGTVHVSQNSRRVARSGEVHGVGGTSLSVDRCGNFYAVAAALSQDPKFSKPYVQNPRLHRMEKSLFRTGNAGSCNQTNCHDFGSKLRWGIYF
jgi:hypothetical protein